MNVAHYFTFFRILVCPFFALFYLKPEWFGLGHKVLPYALIAILVIAEFTDLFDGFLARKKNQVTDLGKVIDPMADSMTHLTIFFSFTQGIVGLPILVVLIFLYRDFVISTLRILCALRGIALAARPSGKLKAVIQAAVSFFIVIMMIPHSMGYLTTSSLSLVSTIAVCLAALYTILSAGDYLYANRAHLLKAVQSE